jgi:hypothetical protein
MRAAAPPSGDVSRRRDNHAKTGRQRIHPATAGKGRARVSLFLPIISLFAGAKFPVPENTRFTPKFLRLRRYSPQIIPKRPKNRVKFKKFPVSSL